mmetsp:Transcript_3487/g.11640  ORF Transcript_3487/g.11640 Transcript_3487/m.11640 type:complete len:233 (-) Transcript_3487:221-919(-)
MQLRYSPSAVSASCFATATCATSRRHARESRVGLPGERDLARRSAAEACSSAAAVFPAASLCRAAIRSAASRCAAHGSSPPALPAPSRSPARGARTSPVPVLSILAIQSSTASQAPITFPSSAGATPDTRADGPDGPTLIPGASAAPMKSAAAARRWSSKHALVSGSTSLRPSKKARAASAAWPPSRRVRWHKTRPFAESVVSGLEAPAPATEACLRRISSSESSSPMAPCR